MFSAYDAAAVSTAAAAAAAAPSGHDATAADATAAATTAATAAEPWPNGQRQHAKRTAGMKINYCHFQSSILVQKNVVQCDTI